MSKLENSVKELTKYVRNEVIRLDLEEKENLDWESYGRYSALYDVLCRLEVILDQNEE